MFYLKNTHRFFLHILLFFSGLSALQAATITVTNGSDGGSGSLRNAVNSAVSGDLIIFSASVTTVSLTSGEIAVNKSLTIDGGSSGVTITRITGNFRLFNVTSGTLSFIKINLTNGNTTDPNGGAAVAGTSSVTLSFNGCNITGNTTTGGGAAIIASGPTTFINCRIANNTTTNTVGHAILLYPPGTLTMTGCTVSGNIGNTGGAAVDIRGGGGGNTTVTITNCTISGNDESGIIIPNNECTAVLTNVTITNNGSGITNYSNKCTIKNCIVSDNSGVDIATEGPVFLNSTYNLIGSPGNSGLVNGVGNNQVGVNDPKLLALASNGGATQTHALSPCSPAINAGTSSGAPSTDQRGSSRFGAVDIGSYEYQSSPTSFTLNTVPSPPTCNGLSNGSIAVSILGGTSPYTYAWSGTGTGTNPRTNLAAGTYTVTVTDNGGCTGTRSTTLSAPAVITINTSVANVLCNGGNSGEIDLTVTGGTSPYSYAWTGSGTGTDPRTNLTAGTYTVTVTDNNGCTRTNISTVTQPSVITVTPTPNNASCGSANGSISLVVTGGNSPYTFAWTGTGTGGNPRTGLAAGTYTVTVTDNFGCTRTSSATISSVDNTPPSITCPANATVAAGASCTATLASYTASTTASDNCGGSPTITQTPASGTNVTLGANTVTMRATDAAGNSSTCSFAVTVADQTSPTITCPANTTVAASASCTGTLANYTTSTTSSDNCTGSPFINQFPTSGSSMSLGTTTVTMRATDGVNNTSTCSFMVTVADQTAPTITCPANTTVAANSSCIATLASYTASTTSSDNCSASPTETQTPAAGTNVTLGANIVTMRATDGAGNSSTCSFTVTVADQTAPTITCPANTTVAANSNCIATLANYTASTTSSDNCSASPTETQMPSSGVVIAIGANTVTMRATDGAGNSSTCSFTVTVNDVTPPTITNCPANTTVSADANGNYTMPTVTSIPTVTDNCTLNPTRTQTPTAGTVLTVGTVTVTFTATDPSGNSASCAYSLTVTPGCSAPVITCPANTTIAAGANCTASLPNYTSQATVTNGCGTNIVTQSPAVGTTLSQGAHVVTLTATDANGSTSTCTFSVMVADQTAPTITCPANTTVAANSSCIATLASYTASTTSSDNCTASPTETQTPAAGTNVTVGANTVTMRATDAAGNSSTCSFTVTVVDQTPPTFACPANTTVAAGANCTATLANYAASVTASDNCSANPNETQSPVAGTTITGSQTVTLTATDAAGNSATCSFLVTVADQTPPSITCPANTTTSGDANCMATVTAFTGSATTNDNCTATPTVTQSPVVGTTFTGSQIITLTSSDAVGNSSTCSFNLVITDQTAPSITCPASTTVAAGANCTAVLASYTAAASASDNCTVNPTKTQSPAAGTTFTGSQTVTLTATDAAGNSATCSFVVTVADQTPPTFACPANTTVAAGANCTATLANYAASVTASDNCSANPTENQFPAAGTTFTGSQTVTLTATDAAGNSATCSFVVTVADQTPPTFACPANTTVAAGANCGAILANYAASVTASDNCSANPNETQVPEAGALFIGTQTITLRATDAAGNTSTCSFTVTAADQTPPTFACPANTTVAAGANCTATLANYAASVTASDNCSANPNETQSPAAGTTFTGSQTVTLTATDAAGNSATCSFVVTVTDQTPPTFACPANTTVAASANCTATLANYAASVTASDNCSANPNETQSPAAGTTFTGSQTVTLTATDAAGNSATCSFVVTVTDQTPPTFTCPANTTVAAGANCTATLANYAASVTASDNCSANPNETQSPAAGTTFTGSQTVTLTATDAAGNSATCSFVVTAADQTAPTITCPANVQVPASATCPVPLPSYVASATTSDNCTGTPTVTQTPAVGTLIFLGSQLVELTATDAAGNTSRCSFNFRVTDQTPPTITCPANTTVAAGANCSATLANYIDNVTIVDNCSSTIDKNQTPTAGTNITGVQTVTLFASDFYNNSSTCTFVVTVVDQTAPSITCPANTTVAAGANCTATLANYAASVTASDNCSANPNETQSPAAGTTFSGSQTVTLTATDAAGNSATCSFVVTVVDQTPPTFACPANTTVAAGANCTATLANYAASVTASDNCSANPNETQSPAAGTSISGTQTVVLTATDAAGNSSTCSFVVTVVDQTAPSITCPANTTVAVAGVNCNATLGNYAASVSATDNCTVNPNESQSPVSGTTISGVQVVTLTATDVAGNSSTCSFNVTAIDQTAPTVTCKPFVTTLGANGTVTVNTADVFQSGSDNCSTVNQVSVTPNTLTCANIGLTTVVLTVSDNSGNTATCSAIVKLSDNLAPTVVCKNFSASLNATGTVTITPANVFQSGTDNCGTVAPITVTPATFNCSNLGNNVVTLIAIDGSGNQATCSAIVTVTDPIAPVALCKNATVSIPNTGSASVTPTMINNGTTDNCSFTLAVSPATFTCAQLGLNTVVLTATDASGNTATCSATVNVRDLTGPVALCKNATIFLNSTGEATLNPSQVDNGSFDACGIASTTVSDNLFNCSDIGTPIAVFLRVRDINGNLSTCTSYVTVRDNTAPTASCEDVQVTLGANGKVAVYGAALAAGSTDNCGVWSYTPIAKVYTTANIGVNYLTITVKDWSGNAATCVSEVTVFPNDNLGGNGNGTQSVNDEEEDLDSEILESEITEELTIEIDSDISMALDNTKIEVLIYPNPTMHDAFVEFELPYKSDYRVVLMDATGRLAYVSNGYGAEGFNRLVLPMSELPSGVYFMELRAGTLVTRKQLIRQE